MDSLACIILSMIHLFTISIQAETQTNFLILFVEDINMLNVILKADSLSDHEKLLEHNQKLRDLFDIGHLKGFKQLFDRSVVFSNMLAEVSSTATTAALLTGTMAVNTGFIRGKILPFKELPSLASTGGIPDNIKTIADLLCGYTTSYIGYWKLGFGDHGTNDPTEHGFDYWTGVATPHSGYCKGVNGSDEVEIGGFRYQYLDIMYKTLPLWLSISCGILLLYAFNQLSIKGTFDCLLYVYCCTFIFYLLLEAFVAIKPASCVLYQDSSILSQPYNAENITLHLTSSTINLLNVVSKEETPFYIHLNYLHMRQPYFSANFFKGNTSDPLQKFISSAVELDWSIQKILQTLENNNQLKDTVIILTGGGNDCDEMEHINNIKNTWVYHRNSAVDYQWKKAAESSTLKNCFSVPFLISWQKAKRRTISHSISMTDVFNTILHIANVPSIQQTTGYSLLPLIIKDDVKSYFQRGNNYIKSVFGEIPMKEINTNNSMSCQTYTIEQEFEIAARNYAIMNNQLRNRTLYFYQNIVKPSAVLLEGQYWVVMSSRSTGNNLSSMIVDILQKYTQLSNSTLEKYYQIALSLSEDHVSNRKNRWSSQFEMPLYPWIFPCANFPTCREVFEIKHFPSLEPFDINQIY